MKGYTAAAMKTITQLETILEELEQAEGVEALQTAIEHLRDQMAVDHMVYHWVDSSGDHYGCGTYADAWRERYLEMNYIRIDPVIVGCFQIFHAVDWKRLDWSSKASRSFREDSMKHGIGNQGFSIPIRGPAGQFALFTISHTCDDASWEAFTSENRRDLILIAHFFNQQALELEKGRKPFIQSASLSPREVDAMTLLALGHSRAQVADELSISEHTVRVYIESARFKLGAMNTTHAVARALSRGLIVV
ncbi:MAG: LuxR family transcriptional regulator [Ascidiaceihabitans sp.]|uniref:helix-turn-helix transcriptional regulator n=1 Tax=Ascidiaceihabitans sp. TaxID=1872644 RepID=UPI003297B5DD